MKNKLIWAFYVLFGVCFTLVCINAVFKSCYFSPFKLMIGSLLSAAAIGIIYKLINKFGDVSEKNYYKILIIFSVAFFIVEIILGLKWKYDPMYDIGALHKAAAEWVKTGTFKSYYDYFSAFPNNLGAMTFLFIFAKIVSLFGVTDFYPTFIIITSAMVTATMSLVSLVCKRFAGTKSGLFALAMILISTQFFFMGGAVYTDALSIMFPVLIIWLYLVSNEKQGREKLIYYVLIGVAASIGGMIKITVLIMAIAVIIDMIFKHGVKEAAKLTVCVFVIFAALSASLNAYIYSAHLDRENAAKLERPHNHWIMMGLKDDGRYNPDDYQFTDSFDDPKEKRKAINAEIVKRVKERKVSGMYDLIAAKSAIDFGDGTYGMADFLGQPSSSQTKLRDWVLYDGKNYEKYSTYVTSIHLALMYIMLLGAFAYIAGRKKKKEHFVLYLGVFGIWLFLMCWETNRRYFTNFTPVILSCAVLNADCLVSLWGKIKNIFKIELNINFR